MARVEREQDRDAPRPISRRAAPVVGARRIFGGLDVPASLVGMLTARLVAGALGGLWGERYHRRADAALLGAERTRARATT